MAFAVFSRNNGDEKRMRRNSRKFALAARMCFLLGLSNGLPSSLRMLPCGRHIILLEDITWAKTQVEFYFFKRLPSPVKTTISTFPHHWQNCSRRQRSSQHTWHLYINSEAWLLTVAICHHFFSWEEDPRPSCSSRMRNLACNFTGGKKDWYIYLNSETKD